MIGQAQYLYASGDLLDQPNTYFYSEYGGRAFLQAWRRQRSEGARDESKSVTTANGSEKDSAQAMSQTDLLLESVYRHFRSEGDAGEIRSVLDRLVQRFEVTKRLHGEYGPNWRPVDPMDYRRMERYVRFAEILHLAYQSTGGLPYLNALLKVMDTLTASRSALNAQQLTRLRALIVHEQNHVNRLALCLAEKTNAA